MGEAFAVATFLFVEANIFLGEAKHRSLYNSERL